MRFYLNRLAKIIANHWLEMVLVFVAALAGLSVITLLVNRFGGGQIVVELIVTAVIITIIVEISRFRTFQKLDLLRLQAETSGSLGQEITANTELDILLKEITDLIQDEFKYENVGIALTDNHNKLTHYIHTGTGAYMLASEQYLNPEDALGYVAANKSFVCINSGKLDGSEVQPTLLPGMRSQLALPLAIGEQISGVLDIQSHDAIAFDSDHILVLQSIAAQTAVTIRNTILYQREASRRDFAETLYNIGLSLAGTLNREEVLGNILEQLEAIVPYHRGSLLVHNEEEEELEIVAARGFPEDSQPLQIKIPLDTGDDNDIFRTIYRTQTPLVIPDVSKQKNWQYVEGLPEAISWLGVPLLHDNHVIGMLSLVRERGQAYSEDDAFPATTFAGQAALALHNAELYNQIEKFNEQLSYEVQRRTEAVIQLARLDQAKTDFINVAAHELRPPLTTIKGYSQMLLNEKEVTENVYQNDLVSGIYSGAMRLHEIVNNMLNVAKIDNETLDLHFQQVNLAHLLDRVCSSLENTLKERKLVLNVQPLAGLPEIEADLAGLRTVFNHLLMNAIKYTPDGGEISISHKTVKKGKDTGQVEVVVSDTGIGIAPETQELIFTKFFQTGKVALHSSGKTKFKGGGPGLGLAIVRGIIEAHHGQVWVESPGYDETTLPGSKFHVRLPLKQSV